jgi:hypothetical protein
MNKKKKVNTKGLALSDYRLQTDELFETNTKMYVLLTLIYQIIYYKCVIVIIYATSFCVNWAFLIARGTRLKHERSEGFKASRAIRKAQFTKKRIAYKILLFETTSLKLPNL